MDLQEIRKRKEKLEAKIESLIVDFNEECGVEVQEISQRRELVQLGRSPVLQIVAIVKI